jgi:aspartyl protease family protein
MSQPFNAQRGLIEVPAELEGPAKKVRLKLAVDTGASYSLIPVGLLVAAGYDPALAPVRVQVTMGSGVVYLPYLPVLRLSALGHHRTNFSVLGHTLPPSASIEGLLGLDFMRGQVLTQRR